MIAQKSDRIKNKFTVNQNSLKYTKNSIRDDRFLILNLIGEKYGKLFDIIKSLESTNSRLDKEEILRESMSQQLDNFFEGVKLALDPMITFGIKKIPEAYYDGEGLSWEEFLETVDKLSSRQLTGNEAKETVNDMSKKCKMDEWNYFYRRVLSKDLKCGVSQKTVNKVAKKFPKYSIPVFSCQLANDAANHESKMRGKKQVEVKLDGVRVIVIIEKSGKCSVEMENNFTF